MLKQTGRAGAAALLAMICSTAAQSQVQSEADYCAGVRRLGAAADEMLPFASIMGNASGYVRLPNGWSCRRDDRDQRRVSCGWGTESPRSASERLAAETARCVPAATRSGLSPDDIRFRLGRLSLYLHNEMLASGPGSGVSLSVGPYPEPGEAHRRRD